MAKLTVAAIERLKPHPIKRIEVSDGDVSGLRLVITPTGARSWVLRYRQDGKAKKLTLGSADRISLKTAREIARKANDQVGAGRDPAAEKRQVRLDASNHSRDFEVIAEEFIRLYARVENKSWKHTARRLGFKAVEKPAAAPTGGAPKKKPEAPELILTPTGRGPVAAWRGKRTDAIRDEDVEKLLKQILDRGAPIMANRVFSALRKFFNWCKERRYVTSSPCAGMRRPRLHEPSRERELSGDELRQVWQAADREGWPFGPFTQLLILTGQRKSEVAGMRWSEINLETKTWTLPSSRVKNARQHSVPLSDAAITIIEALPRTSDEFAFSTNDRTVISGFSHAQARLRYGMEPWTFHDLRRTFTSGLARLGVPPHICEAALNHKSGVISGVAKIYNRYTYQREKRAAMKRWAQEVQAIVEGREPASSVIELADARAVQ